MAAPTLVFSFRFMRSRIQYVDIKTYLPGDILTKIDSASMAVSRSPRLCLIINQWNPWLECRPHEASWPQRQRYLQESHDWHLARRDLAAKQTGIYDPCGPMVPRRIERRHA